MHTRSNIFNQYEFTAEDLDAAMSITDVILINQKATNVENILNKYIKEKHEITTLNGNTWKLMGYQLTGYTVKITKTYEVLSPNLETKFYPIQNEL